MAGRTHQACQSRPETKPIVVRGSSFALNGKNVSYRFHVDEETQELVNDHYGGPVTEDSAVPMPTAGGTWSRNGHHRREFPDVGKGDFRLPAVRIKQAQGFTICDFRYQSYTIIDGKPEIPGLPSLFGGKDEVSTLIITLLDEKSRISAQLSYSIFPAHDAITRSVTIINNGKDAVVVEKLASFSIDFPYSDYDVLQLQGEWARECTPVRRAVDYGRQGFGSATGCSSHFSNPFLALVDSNATETNGDAWGFSLVYSGSFSAEVEKSPQGLTRVVIGTNPDQLSWPLSPQKTFIAPECVSVFSNNTGIGGMSRKYHRLYRQHLVKSQWGLQTRPTLLNSWEVFYFNFDSERIYRLAQESAKLGVKLFVMDDGWFGDKFPRLNPSAGLGDWAPNPDRFPNGLNAVVQDITQLRVADSAGGDKLLFGLWLEPEMVNRQSTLYNEHPDWVLHAGNYQRTEGRNQLVLNLALQEVQDYIIKRVSSVLQSAPISYVKWDNNRAIHEVPNPQTFHTYTLGLYRVIKDLTSRFPHILWEGCAAGGGRFDPGLLQHFPQMWTSDNTDGLDRLTIQFGTSLVYPPSAMAAHISPIPNEITRRATSIQFRAHVAMMAGSFGLELNPDRIGDRAQIVELLRIAEKVNPIVVGGDMWRLNLPEASNWPAALFISEDGEKAVLFAFQIRLKISHSYPAIRLQGLDASAMYRLDNGDDIYSGASLMNSGLIYQFKEDNDSRVVFLERQ